MKRIGVLLLLVVMVGLGGCATHPKDSGLMLPVGPAVMDMTVSQDEAGIVFFRSHPLAWVLPAPVLEVTDGKMQLIAMVAEQTKILHRTTPGKHIYLIDAEIGYFLEADLEGGKIYYSYITPKWGAWQARFLFTPVTASGLLSDQFKDDFALCSWYENTPEIQQWFIKEQDRLEKRYSNHIKRYLSSQIADKTRILPEYGTTMPIQ